MRLPWWSNDDIKEIDRIINEFSEIDPKSFAFRYATDNNGKNNLKDLTHINLRNLKDQIELLAEKLNPFATITLPLLTEYQEYFATLSEDFFCKSDFSEQMIW